MKSGLLWKVTTAVLQPDISTGRKRFCQADPEGEMMVKKISLMKSSMKDGKTVYTRVAEI